MPKGPSKNTESKNTEPREPKVNQKVDAASQTDERPPWSSWEFSAEGGFYYRARKGPTDEWEYEYEYLNLESSGSTTGGASGTTARYLPQQPYEYPQQEYQVVYAKRPEPTYFSAIPGLLDPEALVFGAERAVRTYEYSNVPGTGHDKAASSQQETSSSKLEAGGNSGGGEDNPTKKTTDIQPEKNDQEKKDKARKGKKDKHRKPVRNMSRVMRWRDSVNDVIQEEQAEKKDRGDGSMAQPERDTKGKSKDRKRHGEKRK